MKHYNHFTQTEAECILKLKKNGLTNSKIATLFGKNRSSIGRLVKRLETQNFGEARKKSVRKPRLIAGSDVFLYVREKLSQYWSPEIIALKWKEKTGEKLSWNTIYRTVRAGRLEKISEKTHFRRRGKKRYGQRSKFCTIQNCKRISDMPRVARNLKRCGDFEGDTIRTTAGKGCIVTLVDRKSRFLVAKKVNSMKSEEVEKAIVEAFEEQGIKVKTIVFDNGSEFAKFKEMEKELKCKIYFADPHSPWQRGRNENMNGCLRFFFPRGKDFRQLTDEEVQNVVKLLNHRPKKCLKLKNPAEVFCCT